MKELIAALDATGLSDVKTYIQSGNLVINCSETRAATLSTELPVTIKANFGFAPGVIILSAQDLALAREANPFACNARINGKSIHFFFMENLPEHLDKTRLEAVRRPTECWKIHNSVFYLYTPEGFGDSKLARQVEKSLGNATARNLNTINAILALAGMTEP